MHELQLYMEEKMMIRYGCVAYGIGQVMVMFTLVLQETESRCTWSAAIKTETNGNQLMFTVADG